MTTKRKRSGDNPLADARKGTDKADALWHRKSGAAYRLFVEYYAWQPIAACCHGALNGTQENTGSHLFTVPSIHGKGLSRAAKRRNKKKNSAQSSQTDNEHSPTRKEVVESLNLVKVIGNECSLSNPRLIEAWHQFGINAKHIQDFITSLAKPLPLTFRIRHSVSLEDRQYVTKVLKDQFNEYVRSLTFDNTIYQAKSCTLSKSSLPTVSPDLKNFLVTHSLNGTIARQELASMLPVLALRAGGWLKRGSRVLDMCASPGSKTLQCLELVGSYGRVKANDVNSTRLESLREAIARAGIPHTDRVKYTNYDASHFPIPVEENRRYDVVICDVPCSGDGTIRKDPRVLSNWSPATSNKLHTLQADILFRALQCVRAGGIVSYSTCSLNPVEDEAVVATALTKINGTASEGVTENTVELLNFPFLNGLIHRPGLSEWKIADYVGDGEDDDSVQLRWHSNFAEAKSRGMAALPSMWPPAKVNDLHLERCIRLWPQDHDCGGFFVALIQKRAAH